MASPRMRAAAMAMDRFSFSLLCPVKSARRRGRRPASNCKSSAWGLPEIGSRSGILVCYPPSCLPRHLTDFEQLQHQIALGIHAEGRCESPVPQHLIVRVGMPRQHGLAERVVVTLDQNQHLGLQQSQVLAESPLWGKTAEDLR